ncbi:hypothetical protein P5V15_004470 [Pogonomyrmex californicus]
MFVIEERYYKINRVVLKTLGLWPYQQSYFTQIHKILFASILLTFILLQLLVFITTQYNTELLFNTLSFVLSYLFVTVKYFLFVIQTDNVKQLLEQIRADWNLFKTKLEIGIIEKYACNLRLFTVIIMVFCYFAIFLFGILQYLPLILNIILPLNESRPYRPVITITGYFMNQDKYIHIILLHELLASYVGLTTLCGTGAIIILYVTHICILLKIASCRIENAIEKNVLAIPNPTKKYLLHRRIVYAIIIHQKALEFNNLMVSNFTIPYAILITIGICSLSLNLFQFLQLITLNINFEKAFIVALLILIHLMYLFAGNYCGQIIINHGIKLFQATYNGLWYAAPLHTQKLLLFIMQRGRINITLTCCSIFVASLDGFATLTSMAISYFMVIYSTYNK